MKKKSSYQKQKERIAELERKLHVLSTAPHSEGATSIRGEYILMAKLAEAMWSGSPAVADRCTGIEDMCSSPPRVPKSVYLNPFVALDTLDKQTPNQ